MSKAGQNVFEGIKAQSWAALSLFMQYLKNPNFSYMHLEPLKGEDFDIVFKDGRKIICESKYWKKAFTYSNLRGVLKSISKKKSINENDEILIICTNLSEGLRSDVNNFEYWSGYFVPKFEEKEFTKDLIDLINRVKFWVIKEEFNQNIVISLFNELLNIWLPKSELESKVKSIFVDQILNKSSEGAIFKREDVINEIEFIQNVAIKNSGRFDPEKRDIEEQFDSILEALHNNKSPDRAPAQLKAISAQSELVYFLLDQLKGKKISNLEAWNDLWQFYSVHYFSIRLFDVFRNNLHTHNNRSFILKFLIDKSGDIRRFYRHDFFVIEVVKTIDKIIKDNNNYLEESFHLVQKLLDTEKEQLFYINNGKDDRWEFKNIYSLLQKIYGKANKSLKDKIIQYILNKINLIEENSDDIHSEKEYIFNIVYDWFKKDVQKNLLNLIKFLSEQHDIYYRQINRKLKFKGYEYFGGVSVFWGNNYRVLDKRFITAILQLGIQDYYRNDAEHAWELIKKYCIITDRYISINKPDFLNRAVIPVVLERYLSKDKRVSQEAFKFLKIFILSKKGIPNKSDLIFQYIRDNKRYSNDKKWHLIKLTLDKDKDNLPFSVFVEDIVTELALNNYYEVKNIIRNWTASPKYYERSRVFMRLFETIRSFIDSDLDFATELFVKYLSSESFKNKQDVFDTNEDTKIFFEILKRDFQRAKDIWNSIAYQDKLSKQQQFFISYSINNFEDNNELSDVERTLLLKIYIEFVSPFLDYLDEDLSLICKRLPYSNCRVEFVRFAGLLAKNNLIEDALKIVDIFIDDPSPYLPGEDPEDPMNQYNEHKRIIEGDKPLAIQSVRGWCCWVLMNCAALEGRNFIPRIIKYIEQLSQDKNWYVKHMVCFSISRLSKNRLKVLPENCNILFFNDNHEVALRMAKRVEKIAFGILNDIVQASENVQNSFIKSIADVFDNMRELNENDSIKLLKKLSKFPPNAISKTAFLFIYYAEFRKSNFKNLRFSLPGLYDDLSPTQFDDRKFKKLLYEVIDDLEPNNRISFVWQFSKMIREKKPDSDEGKYLFPIAYKYLDYLSKDYNQELFHVIYLTIRDSMKDGFYSSKLYDLFLKCLKKERYFYSEHFTLDKVSDMYWWPAYENDDILELVYNKVGKNEFLDAFEIILDFPKELSINVHKAVELLKNFEESNRMVQSIKKNLFKRNPSMYSDFKNKWNK